MILFLALIYVLLPIGLIYLTSKFSIFNKIGAIILAYVIGIILGHINLIPRPGLFLYEALKLGNSLSNEQLQIWLEKGLITKMDIQAYGIYKLQNLFTSIAIPVALPLLLFSLQIKAWFRMSGTTMLSMLLSVVSTMLLIVLGFHLFGSNIQDADQVSGMLIGLYTGGTPNLAALKEMLGVDVNTYIMTHTYDTAVGMFYLLFLITIGKYFFRAFLRPYPSLQNKSADEKISTYEENYKGMFKLKIAKPLLVALAITFGIVLIAGLLSLLAPPSALMLVVILVITSLSIVASFIPRINRIEKSFELGMYFIIVFSLVVATMADVHMLIHISFSLFLFITMVVFGSLLVHALLSKLFGVDADTFMVTSVALICSPPFVPMVAGPLKNKEVIVAGLTVGIMGYAMGNYLGVMLAAIL
ncbi:MAG: DUF819 family protein [Bacteroidota bacterium]|nr:MAG: DUF819 family protein [Bacteroidota bacterium]